MSEQYSIKFKVTVMAGATALGLLIGHLKSEYEKKQHLAETASATELDRLTQQELSRPLYDNAAPVLPEGDWIVPVPLENQPAATLEAALRQYPQISFLASDMTKALHGSIDLNNPPPRTEYHVVTPPMKMDDPGCGQKKTAEIFVINAMEDTTAILQHHAKDIKSTFNYQTFYDPQQAIGFAEHQVSHRSQLCDFLVSLEEPG